MKSTEHGPEMPWYDQMSFLKLKSIPMMDLSGAQTMQRAEDGWSTTPGSQGDSSMGTRNMDDEDALIAAGHLLLLSEPLRDPASSVWESPATQLSQETYRKSSNDHNYSTEESSSFSPGSLTPRTTPATSNSPSYPSFDSVVSHDAGAASSSGMFTESEVMSDLSNTTDKSSKRKAVSGILNKEVGDVLSRNTEVLRRPSRKRRYRSLSELMGR